MVSGSCTGHSANADAPTTENGEAIAERYEFLDGEITFAAAPPWRYSVAGWDFTSTMDTLTLDQFDERVVLVADPLPGRGVPTRALLRPTPWRWPGASGPIRISRPPSRWR